MGGWKLRVSAPICSFSLAPILAFNSPLRPGFPLGLLLAQIFPYLFCPETDQDTMVYHLGLPHQFLLTHRIVSDPLTSPHYAHLPLLADITNAVALCLNAEALPRLMQILFLLSALGFIFGFCKRQSGANAAWVAITLVFGVNTVLFLAARGKNDLAAVSGVVGAFLLCVDRSVNGTGAPRLRPAEFLTAAALMGFAVATKYTTGVLSLLWVVACGSLMLRRRPVPLALLAAGVLLIAAPAVPWMLRAWIMTGDPLYPRLSPTLLSGLYWGEGNVMIREYGGSTASYLPLWRGTRKLASQRPLTSCG